MRSQSPALFAVLAVFLLAGSATSPWDFKVLPGVSAQELPPGSGSAAEAPPRTGLVTIESDRQTADNSTGIVTAVGNVRIVYSDRGVIATARQAQYFSREGRVVLSGDVEVAQSDGHTVRAEQLVYQVQQERLVAFPAQGQQVLTRYNLTPPGPTRAPTGPHP